ncbi:MAG TPA: response regulator, partial [bacterium]|nr:response regulator [bacterium]
MSKGTILIVEDQQGFRRIYHDVLVNDGYEVMEAQDGEEGWNMVKEHKPNLVLLDLGLPKVDGFEVLKRIRADAETKHIPIIIFSVLGEQKDVKKGLEMGANDYTVKGFYTPRQILSKIKGLMTQVEVKKSVNSYNLKIDG